MDLNLPKADNAQTGSLGTQIRQGVHWQFPPTDAGKLMNGREMTAADIVSSLNRLLQPGVGWASVSQPAIQKATTVNQTGPGKAQLLINTPLDYLTSFTWLIQGVSGL